MDLSSFQTEGGTAYSHLRKEKTSSLCICPEWKHSIESTRHAQARCICFYTRRSAPKALGFGSLSSGCQISGPCGRPSSTYRFSKRQHLQQCFLPLEQDLQKLPQTVDKLLAKLRARLEVRNDLIPLSCLYNKPLCPRPRTFECGKLRRSLTWRKLPTQLVILLCLYLGSI